jgi:hypothetical protein
MSEALRDLARQPVRVILGEVLGALALAAFIAAVTLFLPLAGP